MGLPSFESYTNDGTESGLFFRYGASPNSADLDPFFKFNRNDFTVVAKDTRQDTDDLNIGKDAYKNSVRTVGIRGPLLYSGWGYDICGLPVPKETDITFDVYTPTDRELWKSGPVDLRWDDERKVWVGGTELLEGKMTQDLSAPASLSTYSQASGEVYRGDGWNVKKGERIRLINRDPNLTLNSGDYFLAAKINYEWRPIGGGGGGVSSSGNNEFLMILGPYSEYSGCCGVTKPPIVDAGCTSENFCANQYAWTSYKVCGYKYYKVRTYCDYGAWASELNSELGDCGSASKFRFYPAIFAGSAGYPGNESAECQAGVRFINYHGKGNRACSCNDVPPLDTLQCIKIKGTFTARPDFGENDVNMPAGCTYLVQYMDNNSLWGVTTDWQEACLFAGGTCLFQGSVDLFNFNIGINQYGSDPDDCFYGPSIFDPCNPCSGFLKVNAGFNAGDKISGCGGYTYGTIDVTLQDLTDIANNCTEKQYTPTITCEACGIDLFETVYLTCCTNNVGDCTF